MDSSLLSITDLKSARSIKLAVNTWLIEIYKSPVRITEPIRRSWANNVKVKVPDIGLVDIWINGFWGEEDRAKCGISKPANGSTSGGQQS
jgi:hypothetical protein